MNHALRVCCDALQAHGKRLAMRKVLLSSLNAFPKHPDRQSRVIGVRATSVPCISANDSDTRESQDQRPYPLPSRTDNRH